jgi:hypothetical protein
MIDHTAPARAEAEEARTLAAPEYLARIEAHCETARSDDWLALIEAGKEETND